MPIDANEVRVTGENSFIRLSETEDGELTTRASHWRVLLSPRGSGHALFLQSELTDNQVRVYTDNVAMARWLQEEIEAMLYPAFADTSVPVTEATFSRNSALEFHCVEKLVTRDSEINLTWYDFDEPFVIHMPPGSVPGRTHGVYSVFVPARSAQLDLNGKVAKGRAFPQQREGQTSSTCCLAWSETWVRPR